MKPYLVEQPTLAFLIEWGGLILVLALVFSPFFIIRLQRFRPSRWQHILAAYFLSATLLLLTEIFASKLDRWVYESFINTGWLQDSIGNIIFKLFFIIPIVYPILIFYSTKLLFGKFTTLNLAVSLVLSLLFFVSLVALVAYLVAWGLGQIGMNYF